MRPLLVYNGYATGGARAYSLGANSYTQIGEIIGTVDTGTTHSFNHIADKICQIQNTVYVLHQRTLKKKETDGTWSAVLTLSNPYTSVGVDWQTRMIPCVVNGVQYLVIVYITSSSGTQSTYVRGVVFNTQTGETTYTGEVQVSTQPANPGSGPANVNIGDLIYFDGTIYFMAGASGSISASHQYIFTLAVQSASLSKNDTTYGHKYWYGLAGLKTCWSIFQNKLWFLSNDATTTAANFKLYELVEGAPVLQKTIASSVVPNVTNTHWRPLLFTDEENMYAIYPSSVNSLITWKMAKISPDLTVTDITSSVINGFSGQGNNSRWEFIADQHKNPRNPEYYLLFRAGTSAGSPLSFYKFTNDSTPLEYKGAAGEGGIVGSIASACYGGGEKMYRDGEMHIEFIGEPTVSTTPGNMTLYFRIYESMVFPSGSPVHVKMFSSEDRSIPTEPCRLTNPQPIGSMLDSYTIHGITAGSGVLYSVDWRAAADGYSAGDAVTMVASVSGVI